MIKQPDQPLGQPVKAPDTLLSPRHQTYEGRFVTLTPLNAETDAAGLYAASHGGDAKAQVWTYMPQGGPFEMSSAMRPWLERCQASKDPLFFTVTSNGSKVGMVSFLNIVPSMLRLELGFIWYSPEVQRTKVNTEAIYLMLSEAFDVLGYRRVEWKCDALNARSVAAAQRLGFSFEGIFYKHMIVKGHNRDTAWFAMLDTDWPQIKANIESWLYGNDSSASLTALNAAVRRASFPERNYPAKS